jgi:ribosomal RNA assembly protein
MVVHVVKIPQNRVGALIGPEGKVKAELEQRSGCRVFIESETGQVELSDDAAFEPVLALKARDVIRAIGRGFSPDNAFRLFQDDTYLDIIDLTEYVGKQTKDLERVRARIIGTHGKTRRFVEESCGVEMSILGKTVSIIGEMEEVAKAREAVEMILNGAAHGTVYKFLERKRKELRMHDMGL